MIKNVVREIFRVYTKTFGGKIWANLHRVSPGNIFGKNFNKASFQKFPAKKYSISYKESKSKSQFILS